MPPTERPRKGLHRAVATALTCLALVVPALVAAPAADAATAKSFTTRTATHWFASLHRCISVVVSGTATFDVNVLNQYEGVYVNRKVVHPKVVVKTYESCGSDPLVALKVTKVRVQQVWNDSVCTGGVSVSVGFPWMVGISPTFTCGSVVAARETTNYGPGLKFVQNNSMATVSFANHNMDPAAWTRNPARPSAPATRYKNCYSARVNVTVYVGTSSDTFPIKFTPCVSQ